MGYYLSSRYKRYANGGSSDVANAMGLAGEGVMEAGASAIPGGGAILGATQALGSVVDGMNQPDKYGRTSLVGDLFSGNLKGGPLGMAGAAINWAKANRNAKNMMYDESWTNQQIQSKRSQAAIGQNPELVTGYQGASFYAAGGPLANNYMKASMPAMGGNLKPMSNDSVEVQGPSHEGGGVQLLGQGAEVEGGETMHNDFVFSDRLGFADEHKRIAKAIGKIETKGVMSPERVNAINRLEERQENLKLSQEYFKQVLAGS